MRNTITVMNAKGGVGKSTLVLALAETLATYHNKKILVIDADAQASISHLLMRLAELESAQSGGRTIVDFLVGAVLKDSRASWREFVTTGVSDVDDARSIDLLASDTHLTLFEREVSKGDHEGRLRKAIGACLAEAGQSYDLVLIDSAPGLSVLTECFLREAAYYLSPTRPDYISARGLKFLSEFRQRNPEMGFAENLGVVINMRDPHAPQDAYFDHWLRQDGEYRCFEQSIPRAGSLQATGFVSSELRSYWAKYPGEIGDHLRQLTLELLTRLAPAKGITMSAALRGR
jgi:chromosome partitioning protein